MQKLQLTIPEPCHENWQHMTPTQQGRFCNACAKEVVDFSTMTDIQVLNYFTTLTHQKVCGRALPEQLNRLISRPDTPKKKLFWYWNYIVMLLMFFGKGNAAKAQGNIRPVTEVSPVKPNNIRGQLVAAESGSRVISGKVTDKEGNPVSFASIKIKGTNTGVSADANGTYSIRVKTGAILEISAVWYKPLQISTGNQSVFNTVLEQNNNSLSGEVIIIKDFCSLNYDRDYSAPDKTKNVAVLKVKDEQTGKFLPNVSLVINTHSQTDSAVTDRKGIYKIKGINDNTNYFIKLIAEGYESAEFTISGYDFKDRKKEWEVLLRKQKVAPMNPVSAIREAVITKALCVKRVVKESKPLLVVDGIIMPNDANINYDDVEDYSILNSSTASVIFGTKGANGAIVVTTKKQVVNMDTVLVTTAPTLNKIKVNETHISTVMGGMVPGVQVRAGVADSLKMFVTKITGAITIYPNPVQRGQQFSLALNLKQTGQYQIQITDASGRIVLQKQMNVIAKDLTEKITADAGWSSGIYYISIFDNKNKLINKSGFIVK